MTRLDEIAETLKELKSEYKKEMKELRNENSILRKEILGIGVSDTTTQVMGLLESKTLREIVEETQFQVKQIIAKMLDNEKLEEITQKTKFHNDRELSVSETEESPEEYPVVEIQRKTVEEQRNCIKEKITELKKTARIERGPSMRPTLELMEKRRTSCNLYISNFLDSDLTDPQYHFWDGKRISGPSRVVERQQEVFYFEAGTYRNCRFMRSFAINRVLRLTISCYKDYNGKSFLGIGFTPAEVPINETLYYKLRAMSPVPDVWMNNDYRKVPEECFVSHGNLLVRGYMQPKEHGTFVNIEILEDLSTHAVNEMKQVIVDGRSINSQVSFQNLATISSVPRNYRRFSCSIEIVNCLSVALRNGGNFYCNFDKIGFMPLNVFPFQREKFLAANNASNMEAMFSYTIDSTDLAIVVALKVRPNLNSFAAAFVDLPVIIESKELKTFMDPNQWKTHDYRKYANAGEGVQLIQMGNIRAELRMTEEEHSSFKIRVFAI